MHTRTIHQDNQGQRTIVAILETGDEALRDAAWDAAWAAANGVHHQEDRRNRRLTSMVVAARAKTKKIS